MHAASDTGPPPCRRDERASDVSLLTRLALSRLRTQDAIAASGSASPTSMAPPSPAQPSAHTSLSQARRQENTGQELPPASPESMTKPLPTTSAGANLDDKPQTAVCHFNKARPAQPARGSDPLAQDKESAEESGKGTVTSGNKELGERGRTAGPSVTTVRRWAGARLSCHPRARRLRKDQLASAQMMTL